MTEEKIIEIARCYGGFYGPYEDFECLKEQLIDFARAVIEESRDTTTIKVPTIVWDKLKDVNTVTDLIKALKAAEEEE